MKNIQQLNEIIKNYGVDHVKFLMIKEYLDVKKIIEPASRKLKKIGMRSLSVNSFSMPLYPLGMWSFIKCKKAQ